MTVSAGESIIFVEYVLSILHHLARSRISPKYLAGAMENGQWIGNERENTPTSDSYRDLIA